MTLMVQLPHNDVMMLRPNGCRNDLPPVCSGRLPAQVRRRDG